MSLFSFHQRALTTVLLAVGVCTLPSVSWAINACVSTNTQLQQALGDASDVADDDIRLQTGIYQLAGTTVDFRGEFRLSGGWSSGCTLQIPLNNFSQINAQPANQSIRFLAERGGMTFSRIEISNFGEVTFQQADKNIEPGEIRLERTRFSGSRAFISTLSYPVRVQNSLFTGHVTAGLQINNNTINGDQPELLVQFNTIVQPATPSALGLAINGVKPFGAVRIYNNVINGHNTDVRLLGQPMLLRSNHYNTSNLTNGASLNPASGNNLSGNPNVSSLPPFAPIEPNSPLINAGEAIAGELPARDFPGNARLVGTLPDIGAVETSVNNASEISVTTNADSGAGSLRAAIATANTNPALKTITFNISGACPRTIALSSALPALSRPVIIDGYTQPGSAPNEASRTFDGTLCVVLSGGGTQANGLHLQTQVAADQMTVKGLTFYGFSSEAIRVSGPGKGIVTGNLFGTGSNLILDFADSVIRIVDAPGSVVGGPDPADRNVIGLGQMAGVRLENGSARRTVRNNFIGVNRNGTSALPNSVGVLIEGGIDDLISENRITDSTSHGIFIAATPVSNRTRITSNFLGSRPAGLGTSGGNGGNGVRVGSGAEHLIFNNVIVNNGTDGAVVLAGARRVLLTPNRYDNNALQPIDLSPDGVNAIDLDVGQTGANDQQNTAELLSARGSNTQGEVRARLSSANGTYVIELYSATSCLNTSGFVVGGTVLGRSAPITLSCATATENCTVALTIPVTNSLLAPGTPLINRFITAVVSDEENNTSEFSACEQYVQGDNLFKNGFE